MASESIMKLLFSGTFTTILDGNAFECGFDVLATAGPGGFATLFTGYATAHIDEN
jgi:hypothetical protein